MNIKQVTTNKDIRLVADLAHEIWHEHFTSIIGKKQVEYMLDTFQSFDAVKDYIDKGYHYYLLIDEESKPIGYTGIEIQDDKLFISKLYILRYFRSKGYGRKALKYIESIARENRCRIMWLTVNKYNQVAIAAYKKFGFQVAESFVQDIGAGYKMDDYRMEKMP